VQDEGQHAGAGRSDERATGQRQHGEGAQQPPDHAEHGVQLGGRGHGRGQAGTGPPEPVHEVRVVGEQGLLDALERARFEAVLRAVLRAVHRITCVLALS
jgi:hypothetical protein